MLSSIVVLFIILIIFQFTPTYAAKKRDYSGRVGREFTWSYNSKSGNLRIKPYKASDRNVKKSKDVYHWAKMCKSVSVEKGFKRVPCITKYYDNGYDEVFGKYKSISIPNGVEYIENECFKNCDKLEKLTLKKGLRYIGRSSFRCSKINKLVLPDGLEYIGEGAFCNFSEAEDDYFDFGDSHGEGVKAVEFNNDLKYIGAGAFMSTSLKKVDIPDSVKYIGMEAFGNCQKLEIVRLPNNLETVNSGLLFCNPKLSDIDIPDTVTTIKDYAFARTGIKEITIPRNVEVLGEYKRDMTFDKMSEKDKYEERVAFYTDDTDEDVPGSELKADFHEVTYINYDYDARRNDLNLENDDSTAIYDNYKDYIYGQCVKGGDEEWYDSIWDDDWYDDIWDDDDYEPDDLDVGVFANCDSLVKIRIMSKKINTVYPGAMSGIRENAVIEVPRGYKDKYKEMFVNAGLSENVEIDEIDVEDEDVSYLRLNESNITVKEDCKRKICLLYADEPENVIYSSSDENIVCFDASGNALAKKSGNAVITAKYKNNEYICNVTVVSGDVNDDVNELKNLIKAQKKLGAKGIDENIYSSNQYKWFHGRLKKISWQDVGLCGEVDLNPFTYLTFFDYSGKHSMVQKLDASDLKYLTIIGCHGSDIPHDNIKIENSEDVLIYNASPENYPDYNDAACHYNDPFYYIYSYYGFKPIVEGNVTSYGIEDYDDTDEDMGGFSPEYFYKAKGPFFAGDLFRVNRKNIDFDAIITSVDQKKKKGEITIVKIKNRASNLIIEDYYKIDGIKFKVTAIDDKAFSNGGGTLTLGKNIEYLYGNSFWHLDFKKIIIRSEKLQSKNIDDRAFENMNSSVKSVVVPKSKSKEYKKMLRGKGLPKKCKIV